MVCRTSLYGRMVIFGDLRIVTMKVLNSYGDLFQRIMIKRE